MPAPEAALKLPLINWPRALARATIDDDRSPPQRVSLWSPWRDGAEVEAPMHTEVTGLLHDRLSGKWNEPVAAEATVAIAGMMVCLIGAQVAADALGLHWIAGYLLLSPGFLLVFIVAGWLALRRNAREVRTILLAHSHCASCGYRLAEIPASIDGLTTCPECGAAWRLHGAGAAGGIGLPPDVAAGLSHELEIPSERARRATPQAEGLDRK